MAIFVLGGTGFIGIRVIPLLVARGETVVCMDINPNAPTLAALGDKVSIVRGDITFADPEFHKRETTLLGSRNATRADFETVFAALRSGAIATGALATHRASLDDAARVFPHWLDPASGVVKALIEI